MHIPKGRRHFFEKTLFYFMLIFSLFYGALICFVALIASCLSVGHAYILMLLCFFGCMFGWSFVLLYDNSSHFHMTIWCMIKLLKCFISCLLDRILLVTLYLSFYQLIYLEGLMCFVQVFQVIGIHVPSSSQFLDLDVSEFCHCSQTHV